MMAKKPLKIWFAFFVWLSQLLYLSTATSFMRHSIIGGRKLPELWPILNTSEAFSGERFQANIAGNLLEYDVQFLISKIGSTDLPPWLTYNQDTFNLVGLPLDSDIGLHQLFIVAMLSEKNGSGFLGAQTFDINVRPKRLHSFCFQTENRFSVDFLLNLNATELNATERLEFYETFTRMYNVSENNLLFQEQPQGWNNSYGNNCDVLSDLLITLNDQHVPLFGISWVISCNLNDTRNNTVDNVYHATSSFGGLFAGYSLIGWRVWHGDGDVRCTWYYGSNTTTSIPSVSRSGSFVASLSTSFIHSNKPSTILSSTLDPVGISSMSSLTTLGRNLTVHHTLLAKSTTQHLVEVTSSPSSQRYTLSPNLTPTISTSGIYSSGTDSAVHHTALVRSPTSTDTMVVTSALPSPPYVPSVKHTPTIASSGIYSFGTDSAIHHTALVRPPTSTDPMVVTSALPFPPYVPSVKHTPTIASSGVYSSTAFGTDSAIHHTALVRPPTSTDTMVVTSSLPSPPYVPSVKHTPTIASSGVYSSTAFGTDSAIHHTTLVRSPTSTETMVVTSSLPSPPYVPSVKHTPTIASSGVYSSTAFGTDSAIHHTTLVRSPTSTETMVVTSSLPSPPYVPSVKHTPTIASSGVYSSTAFGTDSAIHHTTLVRSPTSTDTMVVTSAVFSSPYVASNKITPTIATASIYSSTLLDPNTTDTPTLLVGSATTHATMLTFSSSLPHDSPGKHNLTVTTSSIYSHTAVGRNSTVYSSFNTDLNQPISSSSIFQNVTSGNLTLNSITPSFSSSTGSGPNFTVHSPVNTDITKTVSPSSLYEDVISDNVTRTTSSFSLSTGFSRNTVHDTLAINSTNTYPILATSSYSITSGSLSRTSITHSLSSSTVLSGSDSIVHHTSLVSLTSTYLMVIKPSSSSSQYISSDNRNSVSIATGFSLSTGFSRNTVHDTLSINSTNTYPILATSSSSIPSGTLTRSSITHSPSSSTVLSGSNSIHHVSLVSSASTYRMVVTPSSSSSQYISSANRNSVNITPGLSSSTSLGPNTSRPTSTYPAVLTSWESLSSVSPTLHSPTSRSTVIPGNSPPIVNRKLPKLNITPCGYILLEIPDDAFLDKEDGNTRNLTLQLLSRNFSELASNSWIKFDSGTNVIYGVPVASQLSKNSETAVFEYILSAVDRGGRRANTTLVVTLIDEPHDLGQRVSVKADAYVKPSSLILLELVKLVSGYLYNNDNKTMRILNFTVASGSPTKIEMTWSDCKAVRAVCGVRRIERTSKLVKVSPHVVNPQFMIALMPKFVVRDVSVARYGMCLNEAPLATSNVLIMNIGCCEIFHFQVPRDLFHDSEDGNTRNLSLTLLLPNSSRLDPDSWIDINDTSKTIEGITSLNQAETLAQNVQKFLLFATDSGKLTVNVSLHVIIQHPLPSSSYHLTLILKRAKNDELSQLQELFLVINKIKLYFGDNSTSNIRLLSYREQNLVRVLTWTNASLDQKPCDHSSIANISEKLKESNGKINDDFETAMLPDYQVQFVFEEKLGHCKDGANEPPKTLLSVLSLHLNQSLTSFDYLIPNDTFQDLEDGNTRHLELSLLTSSFEPIPENSWIVLSSEKQIIYGVPTLVTLKSQPPDGYQFILLAKDSGGKMTTSKLRVEIPGISEPHNYQITAQLKSYHDRSRPRVDHVVWFLGKLRLFTGENIQVFAYNISMNYPADLSISWSNRTTSFNTCDHEKIQEEFRALSDHQGQATKQFSDFLLPFIIVQGLQLELFGSCLVSQNLPPVVLTPVPFLNISIYQVLEFQLPEKMFLDNEDGFTRNLTVDVLNQNDQNLISWIFFNTSSQTLYGIPTRLVAKRQPRHGYAIKIVAMDTGGLSVNTTIQIKIQDMLGYLSVNYEIDVKAIITNNDTLLFSQGLKFFTKLKTYLAKVKKLFLTEYAKENTTLLASFSTTDFVGNKCDFSEIQTLNQLLFLDSSELNYDNFTQNSTVGQSDSNISLLNNQPSRNFSKALAPEFLVTKVSGFKTGPCSNTPPVVFQKLSSFIVHYYGLFSIPIPPQTFYDAEDGYSSNLTITLLTSSGKPLSPDSWLQLNPTLLQLNGFITDNVISRKPQGNYSFLLRAQDTYSLKANTTFTIFIPNAPLAVGFKVNMIFRSNFSSVVFHVNILQELLAKMAAYFQDNDTSFINIISFERGSSGIPSTDVLVWSNTTLISEKCDFPGMEEISQKVRQSDNKPNTNFHEALRPEFDVLLVFGQRLGSCGQSQNSPPQVLDPFLEINIFVLPSTLTYKIPRNVFYDEEDGDTRNLTLSFYDINNMAVSRNSSVQLDSPLQLVYGIITSNELNSKNSIKRFILVATDSGGKMAKTVLEISIGNLSISFNYQLNIQFNSYLSSSLSDVGQLLEFQEKLNTFPELRDYHVVGYTRSSGYPARFVASFINTSVNVSRDLNKTCDHDEITRISDVSENNNGNLKREFLTRFLPGFVVNDVSVQTFGPCNVFWNDPPKLTKEIPGINISVCGIWEYQIPSETFLDKEDGNTRNMTLGLQNTSYNQVNISWIFLDVATQTLYAIPSVGISIRQPRFGYKFKLTATDSHGSSTETTLRIFVIDNILLDSYRLTVSARIPEIFRNSKPALEKSLEFLEAMQRYLSGSTTEDMRVVRYTMTSSHLRFTWSNCTLSYSPCDYERIESLRNVTVYEKSLPQPRLIQALAPAFIVESVVDEMRGPCLNKGPVTKHDLKPLTARLCERLQYQIPVDTFFDSEDGFTRNLSLSLLDSDLKRLRQDFWVSFNHTSQIINAYTSIDALASEPESGYEFILNAKDGHGLSTRMAIKIQYEKTLLPRSTYEVTLVLQAQSGTPPNNVEQLGIILGKIAEYMDSSESSVRIHSFVRARSNSATSFLTWSNCTFHGNSCDVLEIAETSRRFKNSQGIVLDEFREIFLPQFKLQFVFEQRFGPCLEDTNFPPKVMWRLQPLILGNSCGIWTFSVPQRLFYDEEEGYTRNLTISIKNNDFTEISKDSWIQIDQDKQMAYGFPLLRKTNSTYETILIVAADSSGKFGTTPLKAAFKMEIINPDFLVTIELMSYVGELSSDVYHLRKFLERLTSYLNVTAESLMIVRYEREILASGSKFTISWTSCWRKANSCDYEQIEFLREKLQYTQSEVNQDFFQSILPYFVPTKVTFEKFGPCLDSGRNSSLKLVEPIANIFLYSGNLLWYKIPRNTFIDPGGMNFSLMLQFSNKTAVPPSYWLKYDNDSNVISGVLLAEVSWNETFRLLARDDYGNEAFDVFQVFVEPKCPKRQLGYQVNMDVKFLGNEDDLFIEFLRKLQSFFKPRFKDLNFTIISRNRISKRGNSYRIIWSHNRACSKCAEERHFFQEISQKFFMSNGSTRAQFSAVFMPEFNITNVSETICAFGTVITGGKEDRWLMYLVPIVTILTFLLICFLCFIFRIFVSSYRRKDTIILDEHPLPVSLTPREIHVVSSREAPLTGSNREHMTVVNEEFVANAFLNEMPEILLNKRVTPSRESFVSADAEPRIVTTPPLYSEAVSHLAHGAPRPESSPPRSTRIEMENLPIIARTEAPILGAVVNDAYESSVDGPQLRVGGSSLPYPKQRDVQVQENSNNERSRARRMTSLESENILYSKDEVDTWNEEPPTYLASQLRLPTPPSVGMLRLPPIPKPLGNSPASSLVNTPDHESQPSTPFYSPLLTSAPAISLSTNNTTYYENRMGTPSPVPVQFPGILERPRSSEVIPEPPKYTRGTYSPSSATGVENRVYMEPQSPIGFPNLPERVPYVNARYTGGSGGSPSKGPLGTNGGSSPNELHQVLGELRNTVNRELDRRDEVDKYFDIYLK